MLECYMVKMMRSSDAVDSALYTSISEELTCIVCFERMVSPKSLKCFHVFCIVCLKRSIGKNGKIKCPTCRKNTKVRVIQVFYFISNSF